MNRVVIATVIVMAVITACGSSTPDTLPTSAPEQESTESQPPVEPPEAQPVEPVSVSPGAVAAPIARGLTLATGWRTLLPAPPRQTIEWATSTPDGRVAAMTPEGPKVVRGERWVAAPSLRIARPVHDAFEIRDDCHIVRRRDGRDYGPPREHDYHGQGRESCTERLRAVEVIEGADGHPIALVSASRHVLRWRRQRQRMGHAYPNTHDEPVALVIRSAGDGWQSVGGHVPGTASVVPLDPPVVVGSEGDVSVIESGTDFDRGRPVVRMLRPRPLLVIEFDGGLLVLRGDGLRRIASNTRVDVPLSDDARAWLERTERAPVHTIRVLGANLGGGRAIVGAGTGLLYVDATGATFLHLGESGQTPDWVGEVWGLVPGEQDASWFLLTHNGVVVRGTASTWRRAGSLSEVPGLPSAVSHPIGAFVGADGSARFVDYQRPIICPSGTTLSVCGPSIDIRERRVTTLPHGLLVDDQSIDLHLVTSTGSTELPLPLPRLEHAFVAGRADAPYALTDGTVQRLESGAWVPVSSLPERASNPVYFTVTSTNALVVGLAGGELIGR